MVFPMHDTGEAEESPAETAGHFNTPISTVSHFFSSLFNDALHSIFRWSIWKKITVFGILIAAVLVTFWVDIPPISVYREWADDAGNAFIFFFCGFYILVTQFPIPRTFLTLAAGVLFGPVMGSVVALGATTISAVTSLLIVRLLLGKWMAPRLKHPAVTRINTRLEQRGWLAITSLRMIAAIPFSILNYVAALTSVPLLSFMIATLIGSAPGTIVTVVLGDAFTGAGNSPAIAFSIFLGVLGVLGIFLDQKMPVKPAK
ncbi:hypothetical protein ccrud_07450 [Corynebacterium crudilactis]|uniref:TVP38/TMEM64 family membrane protein n=2 Tax=Corynebacterium crudilactis TaxID=1652495 RepID=A0A172QTL6_9CORY|nr:hypothetical protein ccrud_07450 [Corynebacterium crudilactis]